MVTSPVSSSFLRMLDRVAPVPSPAKPVIAGKKYYRCVNYKKDPTPCTFIVSRESFMGTSIREKRCRGL